MEETKPSILFVDDEKGVLDGLRRSLYGQRNAWDMQFAVGGMEALKVVEATKVDVVVSDMRMPGMDGAALLNRVRLLQPQAARIVLSGFSEREAIFRTVGPAHQYYVKPCPPQTLIEAIRRALGVRRTLHSPSLLALVGGATAIPAVPAALTQLMTELQSPEGSAAEVARIISQDVGLTVSLLKLTNSGFFYLPTAVTDVLQAVKLLGFEMVRALAVMAGIFEAFQCNGLDCDSVKRLEIRSLMIGTLARRIAEAEQLGRSAAEQAQCAGMLAHVGSLLLLANWPEPVAELRRGLDRSGGSVIAAERRVLGASHADLGGVLLGLWGFTDPVVEAVLYHHEPSRCEAHANRHQSPLTSVHAAQHLVKPVDDGVAPEAGWAMGLDMGYLAEVGVSSRLPAWAALAGKVRTEYEA